MEKSWNDPYAVLGVPRDATKAEVKAAFRRLSLEYHPDLNKGPTTEKFVAINKAYTALTKPHGRSATASGQQFYRAAKPKASNGILAGVLVGPLVMLGFYMSKSQDVEAVTKGGALKSRPYGFWYPPHNEFLRDDLRPTEKARRW